MISIIIGTNRPKSVSSIIAGVYEGKLLKLGMEARIINLIDLPDDFIFSALYDNAGMNPGFNEVQQIVDTTHKFIFIVPEYNGSFPGILKAFFDGLKFPNSFKGKVGALAGISSGNQGGVLAMSHLTDILNYLGMFVIPLRLRMPNIEGHLANDTIISQSYDSLMNEQLMQLLNFPSLIIK